MLLQADFTIAKATFGFWEVADDLFYRHYAFSSGMIFHSDQEIISLEMDPFVEFQLCAHPIESTNYHE